MGLKKQVIQYKDGEQIGVFDSVGDASEALGISYTKIANCCSGRQKQADGFTFKFSGVLTNEVVNDGDFKCPYCEKRFDNYNGLAKHIFRYKEHGDGITKEGLLTDFMYGGVRPKCKCGCGEYTEISYQGGVHFTDYVRGHHSRVHNNWGHNEKAIEHSAETRRQQYKSGERIQWNKGKSWEETYTDEVIQKFMETYIDDERNKKIRMALSGVKKSEEHKAKLKESFNREEYKDGKRKLIIDRLTNGTFSLSSKKEEEFIDKCVKPFGIEFETQHLIEELNHLCDVYIPSKNLIIEFQGDYWHANPKKYSDDELTPYQVKKRDKDKLLREYCDYNGITLVEIWESDYDKDASIVKDVIQKHLI